jgi:hypothetical protein
MYWRGYGALKVTKRSAYRVSAGNPERKRPFRRPRIRRNKIKRVLKQNGRAWIGLIWSRMGQLLISCEHSNEPLDPVYFTASHNENERVTGA